ncbi:MotA/TolQ/ExbB proton channel family protein [Pseudoalteromonas denitrificans]|uniref:Biopolymer transport protein ExbB/TolQ n=1 Tax=Pseudoalteromonas denitrificans DSM 6059 TaxID=1123010 RepID=A0A1I1SNR4_9GAMM|nr:MotA/TolQ/ExbB proton channel family protein [Pseudoalteromonas denitrificans]SFD47962.1 Biopolymer transport protein ExbB/TolQ [Pseudoalteromonas denitrificans DSM 6059]
MEYYNTAIRFFQDGGPFMLPISLVLAIGLAIAFERMLFLASSKRANKQALIALQPLLGNRDYDAIKQYAQNNSSAIANIIASGITRLSHSKRREDIEYAMEESVLEVMPRLEQRTSYLATLANIATLLGLLGTIIGLIAAFSAVANADPAEKASLLSQSISIAMNTTAFGLIAAIPLLLCHSVLQSKTTQIINSMEMTGVKCLNLLSVRYEMGNKTRSSD